MNKFGDIEILIPSINLSTIDDGRGGIFTWVPNEPLMEFNMLYFKPGKVRGNHHHPEFILFPRLGALGKSAFHNSNSLCLKIL